MVLLFYLRVAKGSLGPKTFTILDLLFIRVSDEIISASKFRSTPPEINCQLLKG